VAESCTGSSADCPADGFKAATTECRASAGICDVAESCTGSSADCPADGFKAATTECRASAGVCDVAESCTGSSADCPADGFKAATTECRASAGDCDVAESCTGSSADCPADGFVAATTVCREAQGPCDTAESCPGDGPDCPPLEIIECLDQAQITPTGTTCFDYRDGLASTLPYAEYKVANNVVSQVNPGVFFYYDSVDVPGPGTSTVTVTQDNNGIWKDILTNSASQIILYNTDCSKYVIGTFSNGTVTFTGVAGGSYIIGIQYKANSVVSQPETDHPTVTYDFTTNVGGSPSGGAASINYQPKQF
jgi:hypothetical protein